jgi:hypothetical protein
MRSVVFARALGLAPPGPPAAVPVQPAQPVIDVTTLREPGIMPGFALGLETGAPIRALHVTDLRS